MSSPTIAQVEQVARSVGISDEQRRAMLELLAEMTTGPEGEPKPRVKKQYVILLSDPAGVLDGRDVVGWVIQLPEETSPSVAVERITESAKDYNVTKRGRLLPVQTVGEALERVGGKLFREREVWVKTKLPVVAVATSNEIPNTPSVLGNDRGSIRISGGKIERVIE